MCGIAGVVSPDPAARSLPVVRSMLAALAHRGPDDEGVIGLDGVTLGARRLSVIDIEGGRQPISNESEDIIAVQNGEIYDYTELRAELERVGHRFRTRSDTEVLPHAYEEWGSGFVTRLRGMFALAIWSTSERRLMLARDRFGKKPLFYSTIRSGFVFASEIQALLRHPAVSTEVDETAINAYLSLGHIPAPLTVYSQIRKVPPAHTVVLDARGLDVRRYWRLEPRPTLAISLAAAADELRTRMDDAVRARLASDVPIGVFLSGGLDSSAVVALMARHTQRVRTFSVGFADQRLNELPYARAVAKMYRTDHHEVVVDHLSVDALPMLIRHVGEPFADSSIVPTYQIALMTRQHVTVALTGDGGDELFLGYDRYRAALVADAFRGALGLGAGRTLARLGRRLPTGHRAPRSVARLARFLAGLGEDGADRYLGWSGYFTGSLRDQVIGERFVEGVDPAVMLAAAVYDRALESEADRYAMADIELGLPSDLLTKMDIATMAASLEARSPLLDHRLAEFVARVPTRYKATARSSKILLRAAMKGLLPESVLHGEKRGFVAPVGEWLRGPLRQMFDDLVPDGEAVSRGWISAEGVRRMDADHLAGRADRTRHLWSLLVLELWWQEVGKRQPGSVVAA